MKPSDIIRKYQLLDLMVLHAVLFSSGFSLVSFVPFISFLQKS